MTRNKSVTRQLNVGIVLPLFLLLFASGCANFLREDGGSSTSTQHTLENTTNAAIELFDDEVDAVVAILLTADEGYTPKQIVKGIHEKKLDGSGRIEQSDPAREGRHELAYQANSHAAVVGRLVPISSHENSADDEPSLKQAVNAVVADESVRAEDRKRTTTAWLAWTLMAVGEGYSARQVYDMLRRGPGDIETTPIVSVRFRDATKEWAVVVDANGDIVQPELGEPEDWPFEDRNRAEVDDFLTSLAEDSADLLVGAGSDFFDIGSKKREQQREKQQRRKEAEESMHDLWVEYQTPDFEMKSGRGVLTIDEGRSTVGMTVVVVLEETRPGVSGDTDRTETYEFVFEVPGTKVDISKGFVDLTGFRLLVTSDPDFDAFGASWKSEPEEIEDALRGDVSTTDPARAGGEFGPIPGIGLLKWGTENNR